ncbi:prostatic acid phosphatase-like [Bradysia coprophila]|uniref:prostatic acid phosphatase-like n=1 Tax=Bradysia coprophila TaxID=38358 RepID=UPI00187DD5C9|nr:prostatic acid phosphatase-like [Bradysia coprophila]
MSALANLAGLYPPTGYQIWNFMILWQPVPVHTQPRDEDYLLAANRRCDRFDYFMLQFMNTSAYTDLFTKYRSLINYVEINSGTKIRTITDINDIYDTLFVERLKGFRLPDWAEKVMVPGGDFEYLAFNWLAIFTQMTEQKRLKSGWLLKEILDHCTSKIRSTLSPNRSIFMYFGHDITLGNMLNSLGLFQPLHVPPYASCLLFELYEGNGHPYLQLFYRRYLNDNNPQPLFIPDCGLKCPLSSWYEKYKDILPTQSFPDECRLRPGETLPPDGNPENNSL